MKIVIYLRIIIQKVVCEIKGIFFPEGKVYIPFNKISRYTVLIIIIVS